MPKSSASGNRTTIKEKARAKNGYYMYEDGYSYWGIPLLRYLKEKPVEISKEQHNMSVEDKLASLNGSIESVESVEKEKK